MSNIVSITGNLTREPESRQVGDQYVIKFGIADNNRVKRGDKYEDDPLFIDAEYWIKNPDYLMTWGKGEKVTVTGKLKMDTWEKEGKKVSRILIKAYTVDRETTKKENASRTEDVHVPTTQVDDVPF